jgi:mannitol/fructose-specific phosphotransferase system IIA component (Ntr-type)/predicted transcriptional regulator
VKLYSLLNENHVLIEAQATSMVDAMEQILRAFGEALDGQQIPQILELLIERERTHPTVLPDQVCVPHARLEGLKQFLLGLLVPAQPIPHLAADQPPVAMMFMILTPQGKNTMMLQTLAAVARLLKSKETRQALLGVRTEGRLIRMIEESGVDVKRTLVAADIMSPIAASVDPDLSISRAVDVLVDVPDEGVPVVDGGGKLIGELTSRELLLLGMPKYMDLIVNPAMLDNFEPFEEYFRQENIMQVRELCRRDVITVTPSTPIVQVAHLMMTRQRRRIYVAEDGELKGVIYRKDIVARVLHY